jgi:hypothetical protein
MERIKSNSLEIMNWLLIILIITLISSMFVFKSSFKQEYKLKIDKTCKVDQSTIDIENIAEIKSELKRIENIQNERFSMLSWVLPLSFSFVGFILVIGFINSKSTVNNLVYEEFDNKFKDFNNKHDEILNDIKEKQNRITAETNKLIDLVIKKTKELNELTDE